VAAQAIFAPTFVTRANFAVVTTAVVGQAIAIIVNPVANFSTCNALAAWGRRANLAVGPNEAKLIGGTLGVFVACLPQRIAAKWQICSFIFGGACVHGRRPVGLSWSVVRNPKAVRNGQNIQDIDHIKQARRVKPRAIFAIACADITYCSGMAIEHAVAGFDGAALRCNHIVPFII